MLFSVFYLFLFLSVGLLLARRAVPDGSAAVIVPLGCGFGVSLLAVLPALFAVVLGFTLPAVALAAAAAAGSGAALLYRGTRLRGMAKDPDSGALWACLLPVVLITLYLLHTHVLHLVDGAYHTGQSCYGDMPMHLGFIKYIAQSGEFLPAIPCWAARTGSAIRFCARRSPAFLWCWGPTCARRICCRCCPRFCRCTACSGSWLGA